MATKKADKTDKVSNVVEEPKANRLAIVPRVQSLVERAKSLKITDNASYEVAAEFLKAIKSALAEVDATHDPVVKHWHGKHKAALKEKAEDAAPLEQAEKLVKGVVAVYLREMQLAAQREAERQKREFEEKIRAQAEAENLNRAEELLAFGDLDGAAKAIDAPVAVPDIPVKVESQAPKISGISMRQNFSANVVNLGELLLAVVNGDAPLESICADEKWLNGQARLFGKTRGAGAVLYPGVLIAGEDSVAAGKE